MKGWQKHLAGFTTCSVSSELWKVGRRAGRRLRTGCRGFSGDKSVRWTGGRPTGGLAIPLQNKGDPHPITFTRGAYTGWPPAKLASQRATTL